MCGPYVETPADRVEDARYTLAKNNGLIAEHQRQLQALQASNAKQQAIIDNGGVLSN